MFLCKGLVQLCTQFYFKQSLSLPLYKILFQTKPQPGFVQNFISCKGFVQNGKFKMFRYKDMLCSFYDLRLTALVFRQKQNNTKLTMEKSNLFQFQVGDMNTKVFGHQTTTDILLGRNVPHLTGGNVDFSTKE